MIETAEKLLNHSKMKKIHSSRLFCFFINASFCKQLPTSSGVTEKVGNRKAYVNKKIKKTSS